MMDAAETRCPMCGKPQSEWTENGGRGVTNGGRRYCSTACMDADPRPAAGTETAVAFRRRVRTPPGDPGGVIIRPRGVLDYGKAALVIALVCTLVLGVVGGLAPALIPILLITWAVALIGIGSYIYAYSKVGGLGIDQGIVMYRGVFTRKAFPAKSVRRAVSIVVRFPARYAGAAQPARNEPYFLLAGEGDHCLLMLAANSWEASDLEDFCRVLGTILEHVADIIKKEDLNDRFPGSRGGTD